MQNRRTTKGHAKRGEHIIHVYRLRVKNFPNISRLNKTIESKQRESSLAHLKSPAPGHQSRPRLHRLRRRHTLRREVKRLLDRRRRRGLIRHELLFVAERRRRRGDVRGGHRREATGTSTAADAVDLDDRRRFTAGVVRAATSHRHRRQRSRGGKRRRHRILREGRRL